MLPIVIILVVVAIIVGLILSPAFRTGIANAATNIVVIVFGVARAYAKYVAIMLAVMLVFMTWALVLGDPIVSGIAFLLSIILFFIAWLPLGAVLKIFNVNNNIVPPAVRSFFAWLAFVGFMAMMTPEVFTLKTALIASLVAIFLLALTSKFNLLEKVIMPLVLIMCFIGAWKIIAPDSFRATERHRQAIGGVYTTANDRAAFRKETSAASTFAKTIMSTPVVYQAAINGDGEIKQLKEVFIPLPQSSIVLILNHKAEVKMYRGQSFAYVMLPDAQGKYVNGDCYWVESNLLEIGPLSEFLPKEEATEGHATPNQDLVTLSFGTQSFILNNIGDETPWLQFPDCTKFGYKISSADYGYELIFVGDQTLYPGSPTLVIPHKEHPVFKVRATKPNQIVTITVWQK